MTGFTSHKNVVLSENGNHIRNYGRATRYHDSECKTRIKFTRKFTNQYRPCCCLLTSLIITFLSACIVLYCGYLYVQIESGEELSFRGSFTVSHNASSSSSDQGLSTLSPLDEYKSKIDAYAKALEQAVQIRPGLRLSFMSADILALDGEDDTDTVVHFELKFNPRLLFGADADELIDVLRQNLRIEGVTINAQSITLREIHSASMTSLSSLSPSIPSPSYIIDDNFSNSIDRCSSAIQLPFCPPIGENFTSFPNLFGHRNVDDIENESILFRELIDAECFEHAAEFVCHVLQPSCVELADSSVEIRLPCQQFCKEFLHGCGSRFNERLKKAFDCAKFPEYGHYGRNYCQKQPNCNVASLKSNDPFSYQLCDGVPDCVDLEDELTCSYCGRDKLHCGLTKNCISRTSYCDGVIDCPDGSDEKNCLTLSNNLGEKSKQKVALDAGKPNEGYAVYANNGQMAYVCVDDKNKNGSILEKAGDLFCKNNSYQKLDRFETKRINLNLDENDLKFVFVDYRDSANDTELSFSPADDCPANNLLYFTCSDAECGIQTTRSETDAIDGLNQLAMAGDWPWYAPLFKNGVHSCDAVLISELWLLTTASCFQGQNKAEWIARFGTVRLYGKSPWQQERHIVGMVKSPVEGSTLVLVKLSSPVIYSHFVRPVCLPFNHPPVEELTYCNTLGWTKTNGMLQRIEVTETTMEDCADMSITMSNGVCASSVFGSNECNEEEMAGSAMMCLTSQQNQWVLVGISNWRISCTPVEMRRPRLYDKVVTNVNWIKSVINEIK